MLLAVDGTDVCGVWVLGTAAECCLEEVMLCGDNMEISEASTGAAASGMDGAADRVARRLCGRGGLPGVRRTTLKLILSLRCRPAQPVRGLEGETSDACKGFELDISIFSREHDILAIRSPSGEQFTILGSLRRRPRAGKLLHTCMPFGSSLLVRRRLAWALGAAGAC